MATPDPVLRGQYFNEPLLRFAENGQDIDPRRGIDRFGPKALNSNRHKKEIRLGFIGSADSIQRACLWIQENAKGVKGDDLHHPFPGFMPDRGFFCQLSMDGFWQEQLARRDIASILDIRNQNARFEECLKLIESKLKLLSEKDPPPDYVVLALPQQIFDECSVVQISRSNMMRNLRRAFKAVAMKYRIPTQIILEKTYNPDVSEKSSFLTSSHPAEIAWEFFTALYYKTCDSPWGPIGLAPDTCYIGTGFYRPLAAESSILQTSIVQAFDEHGDGLILRGPDFSWDPFLEGTKSPHLPEDHAARIVELILDRYQSELKRTPKRVVLHKSSRFFPPERQGFEAALQNKVSRYDLLALNSNQSRVRLLPVNKYPPLRGTFFSLGEVDYLYTTGYISELGRFQGRHVPSPVEIADHVGFDTSRDQLIREVLILTKMNWNSSKVGGQLPITLRFSQRVGDIMREIPSDREPLTNFKFYI